MDSQSRGVHSVIPRARKSENNVVNVVKMADHSPAGRKSSGPTLLIPQARWASWTFPRLTDTRGNDVRRSNSGAEEAETPKGEPAGSDLDTEPRRIADELVKLHESGAIKSEQDASFYANLVNLFGASFSAHVGNGERLGEFETVRRKICSDLQKEAERPPIHRA